MLDASRSTLDKFTSQNPQQIMEGLSDLASKSRDELSARFVALQATVESYSKVDITNHVVSHVVDSVRPKNLAESLSEGSSSIQETVAGYTKSVKDMLPMDRIYELLASTFDVSAKLDQLKAIRIQDISPGKTIQDLTEFSDLSGAYETLRQRVRSVLEPVVHAVASMELNQKFTDFTQRF
ncbi:hypothetical protein, conserved [Eimeria tenella]|uniref:Uncharacterized protein n=1 Tax=Eimeria tenella TaxID=5802 RepID=C8TDU3_EIMTE|nr:hypothetical protein, conserved [Eimeria tenella]CAK51429.1 hypothetical protein e1096f12.tmp0051 [Eimeria tenella]CDJ42443.1 hypothetical protein, conserved [Eimeria tenella]|eukprot:XP_013233193.1 hypothetical protein, conserved [Eimeria tenella]